MIQRDNIKAKLMKKYKLMIIEDEEGVRDLIETTIKDALNFPVELTMFDNGEDALAESLKNKYDLVITDFKLPGLNGLEYIDELRKSPENKSIPIIFISGFFTDLAVTPNAGNSDSVVFMDKPFNVEKLARKVKLMLRTSK